MKIAVTGATGFIGKHLVKELSLRKIDYIQLDRQKHNLLNPITLKSFVTDKDIVVHLAGGNKDGGVEDMFRTNILGTRGLLTALEKYNPSAKFIYASSFMVYIKEDLFGLSKKIAEEIIEQVTKTSNIKSVILRFSNLYGEGGRPFKNSVIATFMHQVKQEKPVTIRGDGKQKRDYLYIEDAVNAIVSSFSLLPKTMEIVDICTSKTTSLNSIIAIIGKIEKKKINVQYIKNNGIDHPYHIRKNFLEAKKLFGWYPKMTIEHGLRKILA